MGLYGFGVGMCSRSLNSNALLLLAFLGAFVLLIFDPGSEEGVLTSLLVSVAPWYLLTISSLRFLVANHVDVFSP